MENTQDRIRIDDKVMEFHKLWDELRREDEFARYCKGDISNWLRTTLTTLVEEVRAERDREIVEFLSTPLNTHDGVREKTVDDFVEYLQQKGNFVCPLDCGIEVEHTHPYGDIKKVYIK